MLGRIQAPSLKESSGVAVSSRNPQILWSHGDGRVPLLYSMERNGKALGSVSIARVQLVDWEDLASDRGGKFYICDSGNNQGLRTSFSVHEIPEPDPMALPREVAPLRSWTLTYPKKPFDAEGFFVWQGHGYLVSKLSKDAKAVLYRFPLKDPEAPIPLERVCKLQIESPVTGADLSPDGKQLALVSKAGAALFSVEGSLESLESVQPSWVRFRHEHIEACVFVPEGLILTAESREIYLFPLAAFKERALPRL